MNYYAIEASYRRLLFELDSVVAHLREHGEHEQADEVLNDLEMAEFIAPAPPAYLPDSDAE